MKTDCLQYIASILSHVVIMEKVLLHINDVLQVQIFFYISALFIIAMEQYDPHQNKWSPVSQMSTNPKHLGCALFNNFVYAVGGTDDCMELSSAERYDPYSHTWNPIVAMTSC